jgi:hypothetical protein
MRCTRCGMPITGIAGQCGCGYKPETVQPNENPEPFTMFGTTFRGSTVICTPATEDAKPHFKRSLIAAALAPPLVLLPFLGTVLTLPITLGLVIPAAYAGWAVYWGFVGIGNLLLLEEGELSPGWEKMIHGLIHALGEHPLVVAFIAISYSALGGGIREFLKYRRIASDPSFDPD